MTNHSSSITITLLRLLKSASGMHTVDANSIYRIGRLTQVFTVWAFLNQAGEGHWHEPVMKYVPQLERAAKELDSYQNPLQMKHSSLMTHPN